MLKIGFKDCFKVIFIMFIAMTFSAHAHSGQFGISFNWLKSSDCSGGSPDDEKNPVFNLSNVPKGTTIIEFVMEDEDAPGYDHGGGEVKYVGQSSIKSGAFTYEGPCPPSSSHVYVWTATAKDSNGETLGEAKASRDFPQ